MPGPIAPAHVPLGRGAVYLRGVVLLSVYLLGFLAMSSGVDTSERHLSEVGTLARAYYALSLFVVGGGDLGTPVGGPLWGRLALWGAYFLAPAITASAVIETALRILNPLALRVRRLSDHVIVGGAGRLAQLYVQQLRARDPNIPVVVVERNPACPQIAELQAFPRVYVVLGDVSGAGVLESVGVSRAQRVMLLTNDDFGNLDAAARILARAPHLRGCIVAHVADLGFLHAVPSALLGAGYQVFNSLELAAVRLVEGQLLERFESTEYSDLVIIAGFGRFGQTVLHQLQRLATGSFSSVVILDVQAERQAVTFAEQPGFGDYPCHVLQGDIGDVRVWRQIDGLIANDEGDPVIVVGTGDDGANLHLALDLIRRYPGAHITVRSFAASPFAREVAAASGLHLFALSELIAESMPE